MKRVQDRAYWQGALQGVPRAKASIEARAVLNVNLDTGTKPTLFLASDGKHYWTKVPGNPHGFDSLMVEVLVGEIGRLIDAPVIPTTLLTIPKEFEGREYAKGHSYRAGTAHASLLLKNADEADDILYTSCDDNVRRQARLIALWDLCLGEDPQWLYETDADNSIWSFDHGVWLGGYGRFDPALLEKQINASFPRPDVVAGIDTGELESVACTLEELEADQILHAVSRVPADWLVDEHALESIAWFLYCRKSVVAKRLRIH